MKTFFRIGLTAAGLSLATFALAQPAAPAISTTDAASVAHPRLRARAAALANRLGLTPAQRTSLKAIRQQNWAAVRAIRADTTLTADQRQTQIAALRQSARAQMQSILTAGQRAKLAALRHEPGRRARLQALADRLALTDTQREELRDIRLATRASIAPIRANTSLTPGQKRTQVQALLRAARNQARTVLTPAQRQQFDRMRERMLNRLMPLG